MSTEKKINTQSQPDRQTAPVATNQPQENIVR